MQKVVGLLFSACSRVLLRRLLVAGKHLTDALA